MTVDSELTLVLAAHSVYLFMSNKSLRPLPSLFFCPGIIMQITCTMGRPCLLGKGAGVGACMCTTCQV